MKIFSGSAHPELTNQICHHLGVENGSIERKSFKDGERFVKILDNIRGKDVFIIQPSCTPANEHIMELLLIIDALKRASASSITAVIPYFGYSRQDRKEQGRVPISAKLIANLLTTSGANRVITIDLHVAQIQGFFDIPMDHLLSVDVLSQYIRSMNIQNVMALSPDVGSVARTRIYAEELGLPLAIVDKRRPRQNEAEIMNVIGDIKGHNILIFDDIIDTAGTICSGMQAMIDRGANEIYVCATHGVFSDNALDRIEKSPIKKVIVSDTIPQTENLKKSSKLEVVSVAPLLAEAIFRIHEKQSVSEMFKPRKREK